MVSNGGAGGELRAASLDLLGHFAFKKMSQLAIQLRYREDQPRAPKGVREGGQWVDDGNVQVAAIRARGLRLRRVFGRLSKWWVVRVVRHDQDRY